MNINREQLQQSITAPLAEIEQVKRELEEATDPQEERRLMRRKKELQYLQLWHIEQMERIK